MYGRPDIYGAEQPEDLEPHLEDIGDAISSEMFGGFLGGAKRWLKGIGSKGQRADNKKQRLRKLVGMWTTYDEDGDKRADRVAARIKKLAAVIQKIDSDWEPGPRVKKILSNYKGSPSLKEDEDEDDDLDEDKGSEDSEAVEKTSGYYGALYAGACRAALH